MVEDLIDLLLRITLPSFVIQAPVEIMDWFCSLL